MAFYTRTRTRLFFSLFHVIFIAILHELTSAQTVDETTYIYPRDNRTDPKIRLIPGSSVNDYLTYGDKPRGLVEVYVNGEWGPLCGDEFQTNEAKVACRQLGYGYYTYYRDGNQQFDIDTVYSKVFYVSLDCNGYEHALADCDYIWTSGSGLECTEYYNGFDFRKQYAGVQCDFDIDPEGSTTFNMLGLVVLIFIAIAIGLGCRRYRQRGGLCNNGQQTQSTTIHTTNNVQGVVIPPPTGAVMHPPPPSGTYPTQPQAQYQQPPPANVYPQGNTGIPPKEGAPPYPSAAPYPAQGSPYPQGNVAYPPPQAGAPYPPQAAGAPYPPQGNVSYPPQTTGASYPPQQTTGAPYPDQSAPAPYQAQYQASAPNAPPQDMAPGSNPAYNPAYPPVGYAPAPTDSVPSMPPPSYDSI